MGGEAQPWRGDRAHGTRSHFCEKLSYPRAQRGDAVEVTLPVRVHRYRGAGRSPHVLVTASAKVPVDGGRGENVLCRREDPRGPSPRRRQRDGGRCDALIPKTGRAGMRLL